MQTAKCKQLHRARCFSFVWGHCTAAVPRLNSEFCWPHQVFQLITPRHKAACPYTANRVSTTCLAGEPLPDFPSSLEVHNCRSHQADHWATIVPRSRSSRHKVGRTARMFQADPGALMSSASQLASVFAEHAVVIRRRKPWHARPQLDNRARISSTADVDLQLSAS